MAADCDKNNDKFQSFADIMKGRKRVKPPAYPWQDLALRLIKELGVPTYKKSAVFKVCKEKSAAAIAIALNDAKELAKGGAKWKYFFKIIDQK